MVRWSWARLVFRAVSEYEYYIVYSEPTPGVSAFFQHHGKDWTTRARPNPNKTQIKGKIQLGNWYHLKIEVKENDSNGSLMINYRRKPS